MVKVPKIRVVEEPKIRLVELRTEDLYDHSAKGMTL